MPGPAGSSERGRPATFQRGVFPGLCGLRPQSRGALRHDHCHALHGFSDLVLGARDGGGYGGEALS